MTPPQFRVKALEQLREPDDLDAAMRLARPRAWLAIFVLGAVIATAGVWSFTGQLTRTVSAQGLIAHRSGVASLQSPYSGLVSNVSAVPGQDIAAGDVVVTITDPTGETHTITSPFPGTVSSAPVEVGEAVQIGTTVVTLERTDGQNAQLVGMLFVPSASGASVAPGMVVDLSISSAPAAAYGVLRGRVASVGAFPVTDQQLQALLGNELLTNQFLSKGAADLVVVNLDTDPSTESGLRWSTPKGPPFRIMSLTELSGSVQIGSEKPISLVFGR